ncbi:MAG TPA: FmdB family zinc ribbon protein [Candidatus Cybelea sp.]|jgi:putative FmdB family regulatory protein|nr:FmdB family zinc ribbon protein [Candidatus Cybelea sp.]
MPLYDYACTKCGQSVEVRHGFDETHDAPCKACGAPMRRVFNAAPVLFKGSGFYVTDSRRASGAKPEKPKPENAGSSESAGSAEKTTTSDSSKKEAKPAEPAA